MGAPTSSRANEKFDPDFRWRSQGVSRLEGLTDAVFAIVLALLFLNSSPPETLLELLATMKSLLPFAAMFAIIAYIWLETWLWARRYDLRDGTTMFLNLLLLFLLLFYAYPLKFIFTMLGVLVMGPIGDTTLDSIAAGVTDGAAAMTEMFVLYGVGYAMIFAVLALLYARALKRGDDLELNPLERVQTRAAASRCWIQAGFGAASILLALTGVALPYGGPGWIYILIGPVLTVHAMRANKRAAAVR